MALVKEGDRFGRLVVVGKVSRGKIRCLCDCGAEVVKHRYRLVNGETRSCGCLQEESWAMCTKGKHGMRYTPEYSSWYNMKGRCLNHHNKDFAYYGGRGIIVARRWQNSFSAFLADMGLRPTPKHTLDRIDNNKGYFPTNCRWATRKQQSQNKRPWGTALVSA